MNDPLGEPEPFGKRKQVHLSQFFFMIIKNSPFVKELDPRSPGLKLFSLPSPAGCGAKKRVRWGVLETPLFFFMEVTTGSWFRVCQRAAS